ncbi:hypothetical protein O3M35_003421 [Rhynocoris fuscipes]|uniref:Uncharacterized protein n=1 Tax=Rhynocoris fuscipes TaxID=488301 RepID=A0AAW1CK19_9HEMI
MEEDRKDQTEFTAEDKNRKSNDVRFICCTLRTASLIVGYIGAVVNPMCIIAYVILRHNNLKLLNFNFIINWIVLAIITTLSILLIISIYKDKPFYMSLWIQSVAAFTVWFFVNILIAVVTSNIIKMIYSLVAMTIFIEGLFIIRAYRIFSSSNAYDNSYIYFTPFGFKTIPRKT